MSNLAIGVRNTIRSFIRHSGSNAPISRHKPCTPTTLAKTSMLRQNQPFSRLHTLLGASKASQLMENVTQQPSMGNWTLRRLTGVRFFSSGVAGPEKTSPGHSHASSRNMTPGSREHAITHGIQATPHLQNNSMGRTTVHSHSDQRIFHADIPILHQPLDDSPDEVFLDDDSLTAFQVPFYQLALEGGIAVIAERKVSKYQLSYETGMPLRDLRPFTHQLNRKLQVAGLVTRPRSFMINFEPLQAIVMSDRLQIFNVDPDDQPYMTALMRKLQRPSQAAFEHRSLECILSIAVKKLEQEASTFEDRLTVVLHNATSNPSFQHLWDLREISDTIEAHDSYVRQALGAVTGVLQKDEFLNMMYISRNQTGKYTNDHRDVELILEAAEDRLQALSHSCVMSQARITNAEQFLAVSSDTRRNDIIRVTLYATLCSLSFSAVSVIGAIFGMNLVSGWESDPEMFYSVVMAMSSLFLSVIVYGAYTVRQIDAESKSTRTPKF